MHNTREKMQAFLDALDYDFSQFTMAGFIQWLEQQRGRGIVRTPYPISTPTASGAWIAGKNRDFIFYDEAAPPIHQTHIQLHEMAHMLCGHPTLKVSQESLPFSLRLMPGAITQTGPGAESPFFLSTRSDEAESEAEMFASLVQKKNLPNSLPCKLRMLEQLGLVWAKLTHLQETVCPGTVITPYCCPTLQDTLADPDFHVYRTVIAILDAIRSLKLSTTCTQGEYLDILSNMQTLNQVLGAAYSEH
ncbi:MAG: hypothetical protein JW704_11940 [Anaerolineaceae bacterium]|nr:hypothetical protein [Anaerolineaceae bacterium]